MYIKFLVLTEESKSLPEFSWSVSSDHAALLKGRPLVVQQRLSRQDLAGLGGVKAGNANKEK